MDNQGSLIALTDQSGSVVERYAYDPWGARRNPADWTMNDTRINFITNRGYTGHEHIDGFKIINMNGRVYDPVTAQFFSPDPFIQSPGNWINYNRYSYCQNNPTCATDPSGYIVAQQNTGSIGSGGFGNINWDYLRFSGESEGYRNDRFGFLASTYQYDYSRHGYYNGLGNEVSASVAMDQLYKGTTVWGSLKGGAAVNALNSLKNGFTLYRFDFTSGYTSYVASIGDIGKATVFPNGGLSYSNPTAGAIYIGMWGDESGGGGRPAGGGGDLNTAGYIFSGIGVTGTGLSMVGGTFRVTDGANGTFSPKFYESGWKGGSPARIATYSVSKVGIWASEGANAVTTGIAYYKIFNGTQETITFADAGVGTIGGITSLSAYFYGVQIPVVGEFVAVYGVARLTWDVFYNLGANYGPNW